MHRFCRIPGRFTSTSPFCLFFAIQSGLDRVMQHTILSVDDEPEVTELVHYHFTRIGYKVLTAATGREALSIIRQIRPDLIVLDLMLPDIDGFGVCELLRREAATATIPIIILSAWATLDARNVGLELGALDYLTKPFSPSALVSRVRALLRFREASV